MPARRLGGKTRDKAVCLVFYMQRGLGTEKPDTMRMLNETASEGKWRGNLPPAHLVQFSSFTIFQPFTTHCKHEFRVLRTSFLFPILRFCQILWLSTILYYKGVQKLIYTDFCCQILLKILNSIYIQYIKSH